ncbi:MAG: hypothetical protein DMD54_08370 [Gemmatimonadetes bacterium]|nr:MAG: hypothetical protein DMD54_08370 [Gemmatimonadota bacterium]
MPFWLVCAYLTAAQHPSLSGTVVNAETGEPIPYAIIELAPRGRLRLSDMGGRFRIDTVEPGTHRLVVRQIGYRPFDSTLTIPLASQPGLIVHLTRLGILLPPVTVARSDECRTPGPPERTITPTLALVFDQMVANARRMLLMQDEHPHVLRVQRRITDVELPRGQQTSITDTLQLKSRDRWRYRPGQVVGRASYETDIEGRWITRPWKDQDLIRLPTLEDFADSIFVDTHCFSFGGRDSIQGDRFIRIDFRPAVRIKTTDVAGSAYLDSATYLIRYTVVTVTRPGQGVPGLMSLVATSRFREIPPGMIVTDQISAVSRRRGQPLTERLEEQRLLNILFHIQPPGWR